LPEKSAIDAKGRLAYDVRKVKVKIGNHRLTAFADLGLKS
jgi:hypothetical protein